MREIIQGQCQWGKYQGEACHYPHIWQDLQSKLVVSFCQWRLLKMTNCFVDCSEGKVASRKASKSELQGDLHKDNAEKSAAFKGIDWGMQQS